MAILETETYRTLPRPRTPVLLGMRNNHIPFIGSPDDPRPYPLRSRTRNGSGSLHGQSGRVEGMPSTDRGTGARSELSGSDEPDSWADSIFKLSGAVEQHALHCKAFEEELNAWLAEMAEANRRCDEANANLERFYRERDEQIRINS